MITIQELRIGNIIEAGVVDGIHPNGVIEVLNSNGARHFLHHLTLEEPIKLAEELLLDCGFENWGKKQLNEYEYDIVFCLHNVLDGTSDFKVCKNVSNYGNQLTEYWQVVIDSDRIYHRELNFFHHLQNLYFDLSGLELTCVSAPPQTAQNIQHPKQ